MCQTTLEEKQKGIVTGRNGRDENRSKDENLDLLMKMGRGIMRKQIQQAQRIIQENIARINRKLN